MAARDHLDKAGGGLMAAAFAGALGYGISYGTSSNSDHGPAVWPFLLCGAMFVLGALLYGWSHGMLPWQKWHALSQRAKTAESARETALAELESVRAGLREARQERDEALRELEKVRHELEAAAKEPPTVPEVVGRARRLSRELNDFRAERQRDDPTLELHLRSVGASDDERSQRWAEGNARSITFSRETMSRYDQRYSARALAVFDDAVKVGLANPEDRHSFELPTNEGGIRNVAMILGTIGEQSVDGR